MRVTRKTTKRPEAKAPPPVDREARIGQLIASARKCLGLAEAAGPPGRARLLRQARANLYKAIVHAGGVP